MTFKHILFSVMILLALLAVPQFNLTVIERLELVFYDLLQATFVEPEVVLDERVVVVAIDEKSLKAVGQWPWPRAHLAQVLDRLHEAGAKVVGVDAVFAEPDRSGDENDTAFSTAMQNQSTVLGWFGDPAGNLDVDGGGRFSPHLRPMQSEDQDSGSSESFSSVLHTGEQQLNINKLEHASRGAGLLLFGVDGDGVVRSVPLVFVAGGVLQPSFALDVVRVARAEKATEVLFSSQGLDGVKFTNEAYIPTNNAGEILLRFHHLGQSPVISAVDVIQGKADVTRLKDKVILIGATASGLHDQIFTPLGDVVPGVMIHAMAIEQILNGKTLYRLHELRGAEVIFVAILGVVLISIFSNYATQWAVLALVIMEAGLFGGTAWLFTHSAIVMYPLYPALSLLVLSMVMLFLRTLSLERLGA